MPAISTIKARRGIASLWTSVNPILADGELGYESDTRGFKFGDGSTAWVDLDYSSETPESILAKLSGQALTVDYLLASDQTGLTIPNFAFSRKGNTPYFGDNPLNDGTSGRIDDFLISTGLPARKLIASIPIEAGRMVASKMQIEFMLHISNSASADDFALWMDFDGGTMQVTGTAMFVRATGNSIYMFNAAMNAQVGTDDKLSFVPDANTPGYIHSAGAAMTGLFDDFFDAGFGAPVGVATPGVASNLNLYIQDIAATIGDSLNVSGSFKLIN